MPAVTNRVPGDGTNTLSYVIPGAGLDVEAVRVVVDASGAGGPVTAEVKITDQSGVVIASKPQPQTIDAGGTGSATWALRLDDDAGSGGGTDPLAVHFNTDPQSNSFLTVTTTNAPLGTKIESTGGGAIEIAASGSGSTSTVDITADAQVNIIGDGVVARMGNGNDLLIQDHSGVNIIDVWDARTVEIFLGTNRRFTIYDHANAKIFEVRDDGSIHGLAAVGAITWDL